MAGTPSFDPSKPTYLKSDPIRGGEKLSANFHYTSEENMLGMTLDDGKAAAFSKVKQGLQHDSLAKKVDGWRETNADDVKTHATLTQAYKDAFSAWSGDDADTAQQTFGYVVKSSETMTGYTKNMHSATKEILDAVNEAKGTSSEGKDHYGPLVNPLSSSDGGKDEAAWRTLVGKVQTSWGSMNQTIEGQAKTDQGSMGTDGPPKPAGGSGVGATGMPHTGASASHVSTPTSTISDPGSLTTDPPPTTTLDPGPDHTDDIDYTPPTFDHNGDSYGSDLGNTGSGLDYAAPTLDGSSHLAGLDAGAGSMGAGGGVGGGSGLAGAGSGAGSGFAGSGGSLAGAGGLGAGGAGAGAAGAAGAGAGGAGAPGMMAPMRGGGAGGGGDDERERSTWLSEDEDVWEGEDAPPSIIS